MFVGVSGGRGPRGDVQLSEEIADMPVNRLLAYGQLCGYGLVGFSGGDKTKHLQLTRRQPMRTSRQSNLCERVDTGKIRRGAELCENSLCRIQFQRRQCQSKSA